MIPRACRPNALISPSQVAGLQPHVIFCDITERKREEMMLSGDLQKPVPKCELILHQCPWSIPHPMHYPIIHPPCPTQSPVACPVPHRDLSSYPTQCRCLSCGLLVVAGSQVRYQSLALWVTGEDSTSAAWSTWRNPPGLSGSPCEPFSFCVCPSLQVISVTVWQIQGAALCRF